jgi:AGZA family xanthine/uracil permease-like MFS transporter
VIGDLAAALGGGAWISYIGVILPMGLFNVLGSLQNIESAEAAGDSFPTRPSLAVNGIGTMAAAAFGSCFPTTIYIGHPGWKGMGARSGYSVLNAAFITVICLTGTVAVIEWAVPIDAGMAIVLWIGMVITAQAFQATPREHAPAVVVGILPGVAAWGALLVKTALRAVGYGSPDGPAFSPDLLPAFRALDTWIHGAFALEQGFIFTAMLLSAATVAIIERRFRLAAAWCAVAAVLSVSGLMHSYRFTPGDTALSLTPAWPWAAGYAVLTALFLVAPWITVAKRNS